MAEVARRAGVSKGAVLYHFASREELIREVMNRVLSDGASYVTEHSTSGSGAAAELRSYIASNVAFIGARRKEVRVLTDIAMNFTDGSGHSLLQHDALVYGVALAPLVDILERGKAAGEFRSFGPRTMAMSIRAAIDAIGPQLGVVPDLDTDAYAADLVDLLDHATRS